MALKKAYPAVDVRYAFGWFSSPFVEVSPGPGWLLHGIYPAHQSSYISPAYRVMVGTSMEKILRDEFEVMWKYGQAIENEKAGKEGPYELQMVATIIGQLQNHPGFTELLSQPSLFHRGSS